MTPEDRLLFACTRQDFLPEHRAEVLRLAATTGLCWNEIFAIAERHKVAPLVHHNLRRCGTLRLPLKVAAKFDLSSYRNILLKDRAADLAAAAIGWFNARSIDVMLLKSAALDLSIYQESWYTEAGDVDLVLRCRREDAVFKEIRKQVIAFTRQGIEFGFLEHHDMTLNGTLAIDFERIWRDAVQVEFRGHRAFLMSASDLFLSVCLNSCRKRFFRLRSLCDIAECLVRLPDIDWDVFCSRACETGCPAVVYTALIVARSTLGCEIPARALEGLAIPPLRARGLQSLVDGLVRYGSLDSLASDAGIPVFGRNLGAALLLPYASYGWRQAWRSLWWAASHWADGAICRRARRGRELPG